MNKGNTKLAALFDAVVELESPEQRAHYLARECRDPQLRAEVESLLAAHEHPDTVFKEKAKRLDTVKSEVVGTMIGRYKLLEVIGEGGFGVVYMADQEEPVRRRVALKVIKLGMDTKSVIARFEAERQALALMDHPNIAKVLDAGSTEGGRPYFVMELVRGVSITKYCDTNRLSTAARLDLFMQVCHAIQHAHQKGVIHRDIKPSNVMITLHDGIPVPKVIDFGIAKATAQRLTEKTLFTAYATMIGTPAYMSPEQAEMSGLDIDTRTDVYALGVLLYELLTGTTPFRTEELLRKGYDEMQRIIREVEPVRPSTRLKTMQNEERTAVAQKRGIDGSLLPAAFRGDLDCIVMKCLEKDRTRRYDAASGLGMDIKRHLNNEPVLARAPSAAYRFQKMVRRNKLAFAAGASVVLALMIGLAAAGIGLVREQAARAQAVAAQGEAETARNNEATLRKQAIIGEREARRNAYAAEINVAFHALEESNLGRARELLERQRPRPGEEDLRGFEWRYLWKLCQGDEAASFEDQAAYATAFSPDGKLFAYGDTQIVVRDTMTRKVVTVMHSAATALSFSPRGSLLASADDSGAKIWNTETWQLVRSLPNSLQTALFSPDGRWLLTGGTEEYQLWNTETWQSRSVGRCEKHAHFRRLERNCVAFSPDNQFVVLPFADDLPWFNRLRIVRLVTFQEEGTMEIPRPIPNRRTPGVSALAFSQDGKRLFIGKRSGELEILDFATRTAVATLVGHRGWVTGVLAPEGTYFVTVSMDGTVKLWDAESLQLRRKLHGHTGKIMSAALSPDRTTLLSGCPGEATKLWNLTIREQDPTLKDAVAVLGMGFGGSGNIVATRGHPYGTTNSIVLWNPDADTCTEFELSGVRFLPGRNTALVLKPDGSILGAGRDDGILDLWRSPSQTRPLSWRSHELGIRAIAFSPIADTVAAGNDRGEVTLLDISSGRPVAQFPSTKCPLHCLAFSPDGNTLAACGLSRNVWLWNVQTRQEILLLDHPGGEREGLSCLKFSPDGRLLVTASFQDGDVRLWEMPSGKQRFVLRGHIGGLLFAHFLPDGRTLATASTGPVIKLWHVATGQELTTLSVHSPYLYFGPDANSIVTDWTDAEGLQLRRVPTLEEIDKPTGKGATIPIP